MHALCVLLAVIWSISHAYLQDEYSVLHSVPKIELHAHLHGSIRLSTLQELSKEKGVLLETSSELNLDRCFKLFGTLHKVVSSVDTLKRITREVLEDYMSENTIYLELRSTPRNLSDGTTVERYVEVLVDLIEQHNIANGDKMLVKLILSIDRSSRFSDALDISELAGDYRFISNGTDYPVRTIVGLDFSGNPHGGRFEDFSPLFDTARDRGLGLTVHTAETRELSDSVDPRTDEDDTESILNFGYANCVAQALTSCTVSYER
jgi:adenosine deaminase